MKRKLGIGLGLLLVMAGVYGQQPQWQGDLKELFKGPALSSDRNARLAGQGASGTDPDGSGADHDMRRTEYDQWRKTLLDWRRRTRDSLRMSDTVYLRPELGWASRSFIYAQVMAHDRLLYDPSTRQYTVDRYLDDLRRRYGGLDDVLIWPTYPNIGVDDRNQFDLVAAMPGGLEGVRQMVLDFKKRGVRVFFPIMFWDRGTRDIGLSMPVALVQEMKTIGADGLNGDTMFGVTEDFRQACDSLEYPLILQPEVAINDLKMTEWNQMSWGYFWKYEYVPGISAPKWLEPRHQVQVTNRWMIDKTDDLQYAFFNGVGYNAWENIWGIWNQVPARHAEAIRRIATIYRQFPGVWNSAGWQPHVPTLRQGVFASLFPGTDRWVYTLVNRDSADHNGAQLRVPYEEGMRYFDLWHGRELRARREGATATLIFDMEGSGYGAVLAARSYAVDSAFLRWLPVMRRIGGKPLKTYSARWAPLPQRMTPIAATKAVGGAGTTMVGGVGTTMMSGAGTKGKATAGAAPEGMVLIPGTDKYLFESRGVMIEGNDLPTAVGVQHPWEEHPSRDQQHSMNIPSFYMDEYPVTNRQFKVFLDATRYRPADEQNFLKDWTRGAYPPGWDDKPVTWVSLEDARAYARWAGKRLPHEWEWQYAAQGVTGHLYPWGNVLDSTRMPVPDTGRSRRPPSDVHAFPSGASPFGVKDLIGNVWQWTDEYVDTHTRSAILKGGSYYRPQTSMWYFPQALEVNKYGKYLLMAPGIDRAGTIGFRCVADVAVSSGKIQKQH